MDIFGGKCLKDIIHFYDGRGDKTMICKINDLVKQIEEDLDPNYKYQFVESSDEEYEVENEVVSYTIDEKGFYALK